MMKYCILLLTVIVSVHVTANDVGSIDLIGAPGKISFADECVYLCVDSKSPWQLYALAKPLRGREGELEVLIPSDRISIKVGSDVWRSLQTSSQIICEGEGPVILPLQYRFEPEWGDLSLQSNYQTEIVYHLSNGLLSASSCNPAYLKPGEEVKINVNTKKPGAAKLIVQRGKELVLTLEQEDAPSFSVKTIDENGIYWPKGLYHYEVLSKTELIAEGYFILEDQKGYGILEGKLENLQKIADSEDKKPFLEICNENRQVIQRVEGEQAKDYRFRLKEGTYNLAAGYDNSQKTMALVSVSAGEIVKQDLYLPNDDTGRSGVLALDAFITPQTVQEGGKGTLILDIKNNSLKGFERVEIELEAPLGFPLGRTNSVLCKKVLNELQSGSGENVALDFVIPPGTAKGTYFCNVTAKCFFDGNIVESIQNTCLLSVEPGLFSEPGIIIGEAKNGFYMADGTHIQPQNSLFALQLKPGSYGLLHGKDPYILNVSGFSEKMQLPDPISGKAGLLEYKLSFTGSLEFSMKGFYDNGALKLAFDSTGGKLHSKSPLVPYPKWGLKTAILDKTPFQLSYKTGDWHFILGTVYQDAPLKDRFSTIALSGGGIILAPKTGLQLKALGGFNLQSTRCEEFLADNTTGPFMLKALPKEDTVKVIVEARDDKNRIVKRYHWDYDVDKKAVRLKRPLVEKDHLGLKNYLVIEYVCDGTAAQDGFFTGGYIGFRSEGDSLYLYRHEENEGLMGSLHYRDFGINADLGRKGQSASFDLKHSGNKHKVTFINSRCRSLGYQYNYNGRWYTGFGAVIAQKDQIDRGEIALDLKSSWCEVQIKERLLKANISKNGFINEYYLYHGTLKWPDNLIWTISREGYNQKKVDTFQSRMLYKLFGFSGYVEGTWKKPESGKPKIAVSVIHEKLPLTLSSEWEHIEPAFSLMEICYDTPSFWSQISLCNERSGFKKSIGLTVCPKNNLVFLAIKDDAAKAECHLPFKKAAIKFSAACDTKSKATQAALGIDVDLSKRSQIGITGIFVSLNTNFRMQGFYRFKTDSFQLETHLGEKDAGISLTYLIPLGSEM